MSNLVNPKPYTLIMHITLLRFEGRFSFKYFIKNGVVKSIHYKLDIDEIRRNTFDYT